ncbi:DUF3427 domain-containing protein [Janthinobacterium sp. RB2R34]|uniref:DUF3427 domain-containing protein n=1 Tax=Janthinobacterium sp. RB2R34 TaxID=3424193 RepID=UPI003F2858DB
MTSTLSYYNQNAPAFFSNTVNVDMSALYDRFLSAMSAGGIILDAGCGSGRDAKAFLDKGYRVTAFDASHELVQLAKEHTDLDVQLRTFADVKEQACYDGIWACASLLHVPQAELPATLAGLWNALKPGGAFYLSFKLGTSERVQDGRHFTDVDEPQLREWFASLSDVDSVDCWQTIDQRPGRTEQWLNALVRRAVTPQNHLITGGNDPFLPHLSGSINQASEIDLAVAFVKTTGLRLLLPDLQSALKGDSESKRPPARVRVLTSDYLDVTDTEALRLLMLLKAQGAQVKVYESAGSSFHLKAYLFAQLNDQSVLSGTAFIGSSNISRQALTNGLEWNYRIDYPGDLGYLEARSRFEELFVHPRCISLTDEWIDQYDARRVPLPMAVAPGSLEQDAPPTPSTVQVEALFALRATRDEGLRRGLVVLATGLGKTWLAAFDAKQIGARRVLFVAHREEILNQAAETFLRIRPDARVGFYAGQTKDTQAEILCASIQTLGQEKHLEQYAPDHFDYIVVDEFHHAAAPTYRRLLAYFSPKFLLGLTATPDRSDQSDILSLCDDNLVFTRGLFDGITAKLLVPFHYYGIFDSSVDYAELPWRSGRFDIDHLSNKLATLARARHALTEWQRYKQQRTLAFCVSVTHAEFMAAHFTEAGVVCAAVYAGSPLSRADALERLRDGRLTVIFSVDLFNEGVDLPAIDTVMMLRPTESKILFLQQLGRGLRKSEGKERLVILDFIGNHKSFLHKPEALFAVDASYKKLADFARKAELSQLELPEGCFVNYDLELIDFLKSLDSEGTKNEYIALRDSFGRRPALAEFYRAGASLPAMRKEYGDWYSLVHAMDDLDADEQVIAAKHRNFLRDLETTSMNKSFKMVLLEAFQELDGWDKPPTLATLSERSWQVMQRRRALMADIPEAMRAGNGKNEAWLRYWSSNPINAWIGGNVSGKNSDFRIKDGRFEAVFKLADDQRQKFEVMVQEIIDYRLAAYEIRRVQAELPSNVLPFVRSEKVSNLTPVPYFPNLKIACGHFKTGSADVEEYRNLPTSYGNIDPLRHFIARASGNSMNGGKHPIQDGDYLLLEHITPTRAGSITGSVMAIERQDESGDGFQYLLRHIVKTPGGGYVLRASNPDYQDMDATEDMHTLARFKAVISPLDLAVGQSFKREDIAPLFGETYSIGNWNVGHVTLASKGAIVLLVTLNKQGKAADHRYLDHWIDDNTFHWQSQNSTSPTNKKGRDIIEHAQRGLAIHLFVREFKLDSGKGAPFVYHGQVSYVSHTGSSPMSVVFSLATS